ncbi:hypothetical protein QBC34DRAFT_320510 [Podospora aff. communis PSN243]|uniref:CYTH domain-containing protein n=1 Tax=Podospora aff. communis PSN243 TaxID=3040156 RepID=A0AAV9GZG6_9PEZI|nr:hypothetical protein QBC34DRAFT_320510 [Podospora aff. communis PSN243]
MEPNLKEDYEIKLLLNPDITLDLTTQTFPTPIPALLSLLSASPTPIKMTVQFLDTPTQTLYRSGWSPRIRRTSAKPLELELTYKKRYHITDEDVNAALTLANADGFDAGDAKYEAQVEWGCESMTLSISRDKKVVDGNVELPDAVKSREMMVAEAPGKFKNFGEEEGIGVRLLSEARVYGPVLAERYTGVWEGKKVSLEIWKVVIIAEGRIEWVVEVSFKVKERGEGEGPRKRLMDELEGRGWLWKRDSLKTRLIMENY